METKHYVIINAFIENDNDAFLVARFYRNVLGYSVQVWKHDKDITAMLDTGKEVLEFFQYLFYRIRPCCLNFFNTATSFSLCSRLYS